MNSEAFYQQLVEIMGYSPKKRHTVLTRLHSEILNHYLNIIMAISQKGASRVTPEGRSVGQIVGHIAEWERFIILAVGEMIIGAEWPRIMNISGYIEPDGRVLDFASVDDFNAYQAAKHARQPWKLIQELAIHTATALHTLFTHPSLLPPTRLEQTRTYEWYLPIGTKVEIPAGWYLWMVTLEHEAVEHVDDLAEEDGI